MQINKNSLESDRIQLSHGSGGEMMHRLITDVILRNIGDTENTLLDDAAELPAGKGNIAFSTDSFVVKPLFFPGGDIGSLSVSGTVNDILMKGARPSYMSLSFILEEGFYMKSFVKILKSIRITAQKAGVAIVTGDTKVVRKGDADGMFINTAGIGTIMPGVHISGKNAHVGDKIIVSGSIGRHGIAVMTERNGIKLSGDITSDAMPMTDSVLPLLERYPDTVHVLRDPTRGGLATTLNEIAETSGISMSIQEQDIPVDEIVQSVCDLLGYDPLLLPCEGRFIAIVEDDIADEIISFLCKSCNCENARIIGEIAGVSTGEVILQTVTGGERIIDMPAGELLPRIC
ncbi:Carbamoyl dehydratase HypE [subsurface metagenome]